MPEPLAEQRTIYKGIPARAWTRLYLVSASDRIHEMEFLVDTGNPCPLILNNAAMQALKWRESTSADSNFGSLEGGWLRVVIPELGFDEKLLGYANDTVVNVVQKSDPKFVGLVGLPLLRLFEFGGNEGCFWLRPPTG